NRLGELIEVHRFADVTVGAQVVTVDQVRLLFGAGQHHHRQSPGSLVGAKAPKHLEPVELGQLQIKQNQPGEHAGVSPGVRAGSEQVVQRFNAVARNHEVV